jgi:trehalose 6-phosphate synthase
MKAFTVVSNRLPVRFERAGDGSVHVAPSDGGLVSALRSVLRDRGGAWAGWTGSSEDPSPAGHDELRAFGAREGYDLLPVALSASDRERYYEGACNRLLWPLLHGLPDRVEPTAADPSAYFRVNREFAEVVARGRPDVVWVHDYHLFSIGAELRRRLPAARLGFFLHIPFPAPTEMAALRWGAELLPSLAAFDVLGFQTDADRRNFLGWVDLISPGRAAHERRRELAPRTAAFPISVDWARYHDQAGTAPVLARARRIRDELGGASLLLGVDRLDYTKGIPERLRAYARLLESHAELRGRVTFVQLGVPSRTGIPAYDQIRAEIERSVQAINARHATADWTPVRYVYGTWSHQELLAWYVAADVAVVTPLRDGMNLVAKEFMAANRGRGVLVLSRYAGAAEELGRRGALLVDPADAAEVAGALWAALRMPAAARELRVRLIQDHLRSHDVHRWAGSFLDALAGESA